MAQVAVLMGSSSDLPKIQSCMDTLKKLGVSFEVRVMSAHRTPDVVKEYIGGAAAKGIRVIIAAAGGAAHLAGVCASHTILPVIGIPVEGGALNGMDALLATNAALLAIQILALNDAALAERFAADRAARRQKVLDADEAMMKQYGN